MELMEVLRIVLYIALIGLSITFMFVGVKLYETIEQGRRILEDMERKSNSLNGIFGAIDLISNSFTSINYKIADVVTNLISGLYNKKRKEEEEEDE